MHRKTFSGMTCTIARALEEVGEWWSLLIIRECAQGTTRFDEIQKELGIARNILTVRLDRLTELGILERFPLEERSNAEGYRLTEKGAGLFPVIVALKQWGDDWCTGDGKAKVALVEDSTGVPIERLTVRTQGGETLSIGKVRYARGPAATETTDVTIARRNKNVLGK